MTFKIPKTLKDGYTLQRMTTKGTGDTTMYTLVYRSGIDDMVFTVPEWDLERALSEYMSGEQRRLHND